MAIFRSSECFRDLYPACFYRKLIHSMQDSLTNSASHDKIRGARLSIYSNTALTLAKLVMGVLSGSVGVLSEAAHSAVDLLASWIAYFAVRVSDLPPDEDHPYGHGKVESLSGMLEALLIFGAAAFIIYEALNALIHKELPHNVILGIWTMAGSALINTLISRRLLAVARATDSLALEADALHLSTDVWTSLGVLGGLIAVKYTGIWWIDPVVALGVAVLILHASYVLVKRALNPLLDQNLPEEEIQIVKDLLEADEAVLGFHKLRTRQSGSYRHIDAHVLMDDNLTLLQSHDLTEALEDRIRLQLKNTEVTLHTEPYYAEMQHQHEHHGGPQPELPTKKTGKWTDT